MPIGKPLRLRLYLEGEEIPVIAAQVSCGLNAPAAASIQVVPMDSAMDLKPRTMVHLFFLDEAFVTDLHQTSAGNITGVSREYRLLYGGETVGFSWVQTAQSRALILQCLDFSNYWDSAHATAIDYGPFGNAFTNHGALSGSDSSTFDNIVNFQSQKLVDWINQPPLTPSLKNVSGLAGGIIRMLEAMGGVPGHHKGVNDFFTVAELRVKLLQQITAEENDNTAFRVLSNQVMDEWIRNGLQNMGQQVTFRDMVKLLCQYIYYEFAPNPAAKLDDAQKPKPNPPSPKLTAYPDVQQVAKNLFDTMTIELGTEELVGYTLQQRASVAHDGFLLLVSKINDIGKKRPALSAQLTKAAAQLSTAASLLDKFKNQAPTSIETDFGPPFDAANQAYAILVNGRVPQKKSSVQASRLHSQILRPDCWFSAPPRCNVIFPEMYTQLSWERNYLTEVTRSLVQLYDTMIGRDELLADYVLVPNIGTSAKSMTHYAGESSYRVLMDHEIHTGIIPRSEWLANIASVGSSTDPVSKKKIKDARLSWAARAGMFHFFKYRFGPRQAAVGGRFNPFIVCGFPAVVIRRPYIVPGGEDVIKKKYQQLKSASEQQAANINDKDILNFIYEFAHDLGAPEQLVGMVASVSHNIDQSGGSTSTSLNHVRRHLGSDDEFLSAFLTTDEGRLKKIVKTVISYDQAKTDPQLMHLLSGCTPQVPPTSVKRKVVKKKVSTVSMSGSKTSADPASGALVSSSDTTTHQVVSEQDVDLTSPPPLTVVGKIPGVTREDFLVPHPHGKIKPESKNGRFAKNKGKVIGIEVLDASLIQDPKFGQLFKVVALYEELSLPAEGKIPVEEVIRPPWFSASYANANIGKKIYEPFFGCGSVVDELVINGLASDIAVPGTKDDPDVNDFQSDTKVDDVISKLTADTKSQNEVSVEKSVTVLSYIYGKVRSQGLDVDAFIRAFIDRSIATKTDILGSDDLEVGIAADGTAVALKGVLGFHSPAVASELVLKNKPFAGLTKDQDLHLPRIDGLGKNEPLSERYDVRKPKKLAVLAYLNELQFHGARG